MVNHLYDDAGRLHKKEPPRVPRLEAESSDSSPGSPEQPQVNPNIKSIVRVDWLDAVTLTEPWNRAEDTMKPTSVTSVGILVEETPDYVALSLSLANLPDDHCKWGPILIIPRGMILKTTCLGSFPAKT